MKVVAVGCFPICDPFCFFIIRLTYNSPFLFIFACPYPINPINLINPIITKKSQKPWYNVY